MGAAAGAGAVIGGAQLLAAKQQADAVKAEAKWKAQQLGFNAQVAQLQRKEIEDKAQDDVVSRQQDVSRIIGDQKVIMAANGIDLGSDVSAQIEADTRKTGRLDMLNIKNNAWKEAWGMQVKAQDLRDQAEFTKRSADITAKNTLLTGGLQAIGTGASFAYR